MKEIPVPDGTTLDAIKLPTGEQVATLLPNEINVITVKQPDDGKVLTPEPTGEVCSLFNS